VKEENGRLGSVNTTTTKQNGHYCFSIRFIKRKRRSKGRRNDELKDKKKCQYKRTAHASSHIRIMDLDWLAHEMTDCCWVRYMWC
jgi:hypothetical protein